MTFPLDVTLTPKEEYNQRYLGGTMATCCNYVVLLQGVVGPFPRNEKCHFFEEKFGGAAVRGMIKPPAS